MDRRRAGWIFRVAALLIVFGTAVLAFRAGVATSDRPYIADAGWLVHLYYSAGLFVLGGLDLGTPIGGSTLGRGALWAAYFAAPIITTSAVIEAATGLLGTGGFERFGLRRHVVVVGLGRLATTFIGALKTWQPQILVAGMDRDIQRADIRQLRRQYGVRLFAREAYRPGAFAQLSLGRARALALLTDNDLMNLELAFRLAQEFPHLAIVAHVSDISLQRAVKDLQHRHQQIHVFNAHRVAARYLYEEHLKMRFEATGPKDAVVLAGFGRFGQTILEFLGGPAGDEIERVVVSDQLASASLRAFSSYVSLKRQSDPKAVDGNLLDTETWDHIEAELGELATPPTVVVGCDDDRVNLLVAMHVHVRWPEAHIFVRCQNESAFTEELAKHHGFVALAVDDVLGGALARAQRDWIGD